MSLRNGLGFGIGLASIGLAHNVNAHSETVPPSTMVVMPQPRLVAQTQAPTIGQDQLKVVYPRPDHKTTANQIFLIGTAPQGGNVLVNGQSIPRSPAGHFAPSFPLKLGENSFTLTYGDQILTLKVTRESTTATVPQGATFAADSLEPQVDIARLPGEIICLGAIAAPKAQVTAKVGKQKLDFQPQQTIILPSNKAVLTGNAQAKEAFSGQYSGCMQINRPGEYKVEYRTQVDRQHSKAKAPGKITQLDPAQLEVVEVTAEQGVSRTGPSTNYSRLTPLPKGVRASVTGSEGEWVRLDYGAWIKRQETQTIARPTPPRSLIRGVISRRQGNWTEILFPLQNPVPVAVQQHPKQFVLSLYNTTAQTDTIKIIDSPVIDYLEWGQPTPDRIDYRFNLKQIQQWGYKLRYDGTTLVLSLKHPPTVLGTTTQPLKGTTILIDPGHGSAADPGSVGPTGLPEKDVALKMSKMVRDRLVRLGATVVMTRVGDDDLWPHQRVEKIDQTEPTIALSIHYNALPDDGDAINTAGVSTFWYHPQSQSLAEFLQKYLVNQLDRNSDGVMWNNLALTRPMVTPSVLIELGYMINPTEFEWITNPQAQETLADTLAQGVVKWFNSRQ